jgi:hypothetical protein
MGVAEKLELAAREGRAAVMPRVKALNEALGSPLAEYGSAFAGGAVGEVLDQMDVFELKIYEGVALPASLFAGAALGYVGHKRPMMRGAASGMLGQAGAKLTRDWMALSVAKAV